MRRMHRAERLRVISSQTLGAPVLLDGDAVELLAALRQGARNVGIRFVDLKDFNEPARLAVLAVESDGRRSSLHKMIAMFREMQPVLITSPVRVAIIQSRRSKFASPRVMSFLSGEIYFHVAAAIISGTDRSFHQQIRKTALEAAGLRILRLA